MANENGNGVTDLIFDLEGEYSDGKDRRIARRKAKKSHFLTALQVSETQLNQKAATHQRMVEEFEALEPYLDSGLTKEAAVAAYRQDHPESDAI